MARPPGGDNHEREQEMFLLQHASSERLRCVTWLNGDANLGQHGTVIEFFVDEMHRDPRLGRTACQDRFMDPPAVHAASPKVWQECRVDIDHAPGIRFRDSRRHQLEVSG
jgi:hypothetical protein